MMAPFAIGNAHVSTTNTRRSMAVAYFLGRKGRKGAQSTQRKSTAKEWIQTTLSCSFCVLCVLCVLCELCVLCVPHPGSIKAPFIWSLEINVLWNFR